MPLSVIRRNGRTELVVSPWAALGTDVLLIGAGTALAFGSRSRPLQALGVAGIVWGAGAATVEIVKLLRPDHVAELAQKDERPELA